MSTEQPKIAAVVSLQHVVADFLNEIGDYTMTEYKRWLQVAIRGFSNLSMTSLRSYDVAYITPDAIGQCRLPDDFVEYAKIGCNIGGKLYILSRNKEILINRQIENGDIVNEAYNADDSIDDELVMYIPHYRAGGIKVDGMYGYSYSSGHSTMIPMFNIDYENKVIQLSSAIYASQLIVEYITTGVSLSGNTYIPRYAGEALLEFLYWRMKKADPKFSRGEVMDAKMDYLEAVNVMETLESMPTYQEIMDAFYGTAKQTIKR